MKHVIIPVEWLAVVLFVAVAADHWHFLRFLILQLACYTPLVVLRSCMCPSCSGCDDTSVSNT